MSQPLTLFSTDAEKALTDKLTRRETLIMRLAKLPPQSHKRIALQDRLNRLTTELLGAEAGKKGRS
ncbi:MAG: hypothetical protein MK098_14985 [Marinovum sp.]|nr:hypothetical protein [Marinovum sp.]